MSGFLESLNAEFALLRNTTTRSITDASTRTDSGDQGSVSVTIQGATWEIKQAGQFVYECRQFAPSPPSSIPPLPTIPEGSPGTMYEPQPDPINGIEDMFEGMY